MAETHDFELQLCEKCGAVVGAKKHLLWLYGKLGPLAYTNPSLLIAKSDQLRAEPSDSKPQPQPDKKVQTGDFMRILCPECKCRLNIQF